MLPITPEQRANQLLESYLTPQQRWMRKRYGFFYVLGRNGRIYALIDGEWVLSVSRLGRPVKQHHIWATDRYYGTRLPKADSLLTQLLLLTANPKEFHRIACNAPPRVFGSNRMLYSGRLLWAISPYMTNGGWPAVDGLFGAGNQPKTAFYPTPMAMFFFLLAFINFGIELSMPSHGGLPSPIQFVPSMILFGVALIQTIR